MLRDWSYTTNQAFFDWAGSETVIVVGPDDMVCYTQSADVISQVMTRREAFPKDIARYALISMFGQNVVSTEGPIWRMHRKVTASSFNEKNAAHTYLEAIDQTRGMLSHWFSGEKRDNDSSETILTLEHDTMRWALNIIGYIGFGLRLIWPGQKLPDDPILAKYGQLEPAPGYTMSLASSLAGVMDHILAILLIPAPIMKYLPFQFAKDGYTSRENWQKYMRNFLNDKIGEVQRGERERVGMDIMGGLVRSAYGEKPGTAAVKLTDDEIISNAFIMILAGHETTANVMHFTLIQLATNPAAQRRLQQDVDALVGDTDPSTWEYEAHINALLASHVGAAVNETMRTMPPVTTIPKIVSASADQTVTTAADGATHLMPAGLSINILPASVHRNPRWWPTRPSEITGKPTDLEDWVPERWYRDDTNAAASTAGAPDHEDGDDYGGFKGSDVSASLFRPVRGSFIPFSDGPRSCLGRRIAVVELVAALPVIFQRYSIELAVDEWATDDEVERMGAEERRRVYARAQKSARDNLSAAAAIVTLKFHGQRVPVRLVKRGKERFVADPEL